MDTSPPDQQHIAIIGGGWAGCAAAVRLTQAGRRVSLFEASRVLGGRARRVELDGRMLDNGQHILLGAYRATLEMMKTVGIDTDAALLRLPLQMRYPDNSGGMDFIAPRLPLPAPLPMLIALIRAKGLTYGDKLALMRFFSTARRMHWQLRDDCSVSELLARYAQSERLTRLMWAPLCTAALNTPPQRASAQVFLNVLRDSLGARRAASDLLLPRTDLTSLFPAQAAAFVQTHGGSVCCGQAIDALGFSGGEKNRWQLHFRHSGQTRSFDGLIIATGPEAASDLLAGQADALLPLRLLRALRHETIATCYLQYPPSLRLARAFYALIDAPEQGVWGQFVFDRGWLAPHHAGLLAVVISAADSALAAGHAALSAGITSQLAQQLCHPRLDTPLWSKVIAEKRASFSCTPGLRRPDNAGLPPALAPALALAGDYMAGDYPATLEAAVQSGIEAACLLLRTGSDAAKLSRPLTLLYDTAQT